MPCVRRSVSARRCRRRVIKRMDPTERPQDDQPRWRRIPAPGREPPAPEEIDAEPALEEDIALEALDEDYSDDDAPGESFAFFRFTRVSPGERTSTDPTFPFLIALALSVGLAPLTPQSADVRYVAVWSILAFFGVFTWLLGTTTRIERETVEDLIWGIVFGVIVAVPLLFIGGSTLEATARLMFRTGYQGAIIQLPPGTIFALLVFVMPISETLFFRGLLQTGRKFWLVGLISSIWSLVLFLPMIEVVRFPLIAIIIGTALILINFMYAYVRQRNGLAAAWLCQIVINILLLFIPNILG